MVERLNARLADLLDLHLQSRLALWALGARDFRRWHPLCDYVELQLDDSADALARRVAQLGRQPFADTRPVAWPRKSVPARPFSAWMMDVAASFTRLNDALRQDLRAATGTSDGDTARVLAAASSAARKILRLLRAHFGPPPRVRPAGRSRMLLQGFQRRDFVGDTSSVLVAVPA